jgi:hypothetical protein
VTEPTLAVLEAGRAGPAVQVPGVAEAKRLLAQRAGELGRAGAGMRATIVASPARGKRLGLVHSWVARVGRHGQVVLDFVDESVTGVDESQVEDPTRSVWVVFTGADGRYVSPWFDEYRDPVHSPGQRGGFGLNWASSREDARGRTVAAIPRKRGQRIGLQPNDVIGDRGALVEFVGAYTGAEWRSLRDGAGSQWHDEVDRLLGAAARAMREQDLINNAYGQPIREHSDDGVWAMVVEQPAEGEKTGHVCSRVLNVNYAPDREHDRDYAGDSHVTPIDLGKLVAQDRVTDGTASRRRWVALFTKDGAPLWLLTDQARPDQPHGFHVGRSDPTGLSSGAAASSGQSLPQRKDPEWKPENRHDPAAILP